MRLGVERVSRAFGPVVANDDITLAVRRGTVHAVVGENGAGKTTLLRILAGLDRPDRGTVVIDGEPVRLRDPADALARGIGIVQQEPALIAGLSLLENLVLGAEPRRGPFTDYPAARARALELAETVGLSIDWDAPAASAAVGVRQQVEILRLLYRGADVLILDEPTSALAPPQVAGLLRLLADLRAAGRTVVFISHKLDEVLAVADEITVLRGGRSVATLDPAGVDPAHLTELIVGVGAVPAEGDVRRERRRAEVALRVVDLVADDDRRTRRLDGVSLEVHAGEIVGVAGVAGNGPAELVECVVGLRRAVAGRVELGGADITALPVRARRAAGLAYVPADRRREGLALDLPLADNVVAGFRRRLPARRVTGFARDVLRDHGVRYDRLEAPVRTLSGGNQQRLVLGRELRHEPAVLVAAQPTRGIDVLGIAAVHRQLRELRDRGGAVLLVSEELDELLALADRVVVLHAGRVAGETTDRAALGRLMVGRAEAGL